MTALQLGKAIEDAKRFIDEASELLCEMDSPRVYVGTKQSGATRRASMELTRSLAELRRS